MRGPASSAPIVLTRVTSGANITVTDGVFSDPNLWGVTQYEYGTQTDCGGGFYSYGPVSWFNRIAMDSPAPGSDAQTTFPILTLSIEEAAWLRSPSVS